MNKIDFNNELMKFLAGYIIVVIIFKITFSQSQLYSIIAGVAKLYAIIILPAILLTYLIMDNLEFIERIAIAYFVGIVSFAISTYYSGIFFNIGIMISIYAVSLTASILLLYLNYLKYRKASEPS